MFNYMYIMSQSTIVFDLNVFSGGHDGGQKMRVLCALINNAIFGYVVKNTYYVPMLEQISKCVKTNIPFTILIKYCKSKDGFVFNDETGIVELKNYLGGTGLGTPKKNSAIVKLIVEVLKPDSYELLDPISGPRDVSSTSYCEITTFTTLKMDFMCEKKQEQRFEYDVRGSSLMNIIQCCFVGASEGKYIFRNVLPKSLQKIDGKKQELAASIEWTKFFLETFFGATVVYEFPKTLCKSNKKKKRQRIQFIDFVEVTIPENTTIFIPNNEELNAISKQASSFIFNGTTELAKEFIVETLLPFVAIMQGTTKEKFIFEFDKSLKEFHTKHVLDTYKIFMNVFIRSDVRNETTIVNSGPSMMEFKVKEDEDGNRSFLIPKSNDSLVSKSIKQKDVINIIVGI